MQLQRQTHANTHAQHATQTHMLLRVSAAPRQNKSFPLNDATGRLLHVTSISCPKTQLNSAHETPFCGRSLIFATGHDTHATTPNRQRTHTQTQSSGWVKKRQKRYKRVCVSHKHTHTLAAHEALCRRDAGAILKNARLSLSHSLSLALCVFSMSLTLTTVFKEEREGERESR